MQLAAGADGKRLRADVLCIRRLPLTDFSGVTDKKHVGEKVQTNTLTGIPSTCCLGHYTDTTIDIGDR